MNRLGESATDSKQISTAEPSFQPEVLDRSTVVRASVTLQQGTSSSSNAAAPSPQPLEAEPAVEEGLIEPQVDANEESYPEDVATPMPNRECRNCGPCNHGGCNCFDARAYQKLMKKCRWQHSHWGFPEEFCEPSFGSSASYYLQAQVSNGIASQMKLYHYDFGLLKSPQQHLLTLRGEYQLRKIAKLFERHPGPIVVQRTLGSPELDEQRRQTVIDTLVGMGYPVSSDDVVAEFDVRPGISSVEELLMNQNLLKQTLERGGQFDRSTNTIR